MSKTHSFEKINYSLRPAKSVERKLICEGLRKLSLIDDIKDFHYIGFGSTFYQDFSLFHRELGLSKMTSIEKVESKKDRFIFNKPFDCVDLILGQSNDVLPKIDWTDKSIVWLDYDTSINQSHLSDIETFCHNAKSLNIFLLTINCHASNYGNTNEERRDKIEKLLGSNRLPIDPKLNKFSKAEIPLTLKNIIEDEIISHLKQINRSKSESEKLFYKKIFSFIYKDGVQMLTVGGIILKNSDISKLESLKLDDLDFFKNREVFFEIRIPSLTIKEIRFLNSQLPNGIINGKIIDEEILKVLKPCIPEEDILDYVNIYRHFPLFSETFSF